MKRTKKEIEKETKEHMDVMIACNLIMEYLDDYLSKKTNPMLYGLGELGEQVSSVRKNLIRTEIGLVHLWELEQDMKKEN